jgi:DNA-binding response OmpR family regulator
MNETPHILIVDDETNIRLMLRTTLESVGYSVEEAVDGRAALAVLDQRVPDLMILDLSMPVLDGMGVLQAIQGLRPSRRPRVVVLTAYGSISAAVKATRLGAMDFLEKPVVPDEVRETVESVLLEPLLNTEAKGAAEDPLSGGYEAVLTRCRRKLRLAEFADAETLLMKAADLAEKDAAYFNLLGVIYEVRRQHRLAKKFYGKAISTDRKYAPAQQNMRRLYELNTFGASREPAALGDEGDEWYARLPDHKLHS